MDITITLSVNGEKRAVTTDPERPLLDILREDLHLTGTKYGCGEEECGACAVLVDGRRVFSCAVAMSSVTDSDVTTIEGLAEGDVLHPVQQAFADHDAIQCGFCTPGLIMGAVNLLERNPEPSEDEIKEGLERHLCRCGTHVRVIQAVQAASQVMQGSTP